MLAERVLPLTGIHNFRDYGGYATGDGGRMRTGVLFRSGQHYGATPADLTRVAALGIETIVDLRGNSERRDWPCRRTEAFASEVVFFDGETSGAGGAPHVQAAREVVTAADAHAAMTALYDFMPFRPNLIAVFRRYFEALATRDGPHLIHCFAGKDRTGLAVALVHDLLGVHSDDAMADFLLTNTAGNPEARIAAGAASIRQRRGSQIDDDAVRVLMEVHPDYLTAALSAIRNRHTTVERYVHDILEVTPEMRDAIVTRLT